MFKVNVEEINLEVLHDIPNYSRYAADLKNGRIRNKSKGEWVIANPNFNEYCLAYVVNDDGVAKSVGVHVLCTRAAYAIGSGHHFNWEMMGLEVDHLDFDRSNNKIENLVLEKIAINRARRKMHEKLNRLDKNAINQLREEYKTLAHGTKMQWFLEMGNKFGVSFRCIQNNCLSYNNKEAL